MVASVNLLIGAAATAGDKSSVLVGNQTPFLPGRTVRAVFHAHGQTGTAPAWAIDGSDDDSVWVADIAVSVVAAGEEAVDVKTYKYMRASVTTAAGTLAGTLSVILEENG